MKLKGTAIIGARFRLLDSATDSGSLSRYWAQVPVPVQDLGSSGRLGYGSLVEEPWITVMWSLQKLPGVVCKERNSNGSSK